MSDSDLFFKVKIGGCRIMSEELRVMCFWIFSILYEWMLWISYGRVMFDLCISINLLLLGTYFVIKSASYLLLWLIPSVAILLGSCDRGGCHTNCWRVILVVVVVVVTEGKSSQLPVFDWARSLTKRIEQASIILTYWSVKVLALDQSMM